MVYNTCGGSSGGGGGSGIVTYTCVTTGTVHALTGNGDDGKFIADSDYLVGDTFTVNGVVFDAVSQNGGDLPILYFSAGNYVQFFINGNKINFLYYNRPLVYGYRIDKNDSNPYTRITYTNDAIGMYNAYMDFNTGTFNYGTWGDVWFVKNNNPWMVKSDGTLDYQLNPNDYSKKLDGTPSDVSNVSYDGNAMSYFPIIWFKRWEDTNYQYCNVCEVQLDDTYHAYAHTRADGTVMNYRLLSIYNSSGAASKARSLSGKVPLANLTTTQEIDACVANGSLWYTQTYSDWAMVGDLLRLISISDDGQGTFGYGNCGTTAAINSGSLDTAGQFYGKSETQSVGTAVKVFHMENRWGNIWNRIAGLINNNGIIYTKSTQPYNFTGDGYVNTGLTPSGTGGSYIKLSRMTNNGRFGFNSAGGSASTYLCDGLWYNNSIIAYALVGGVWAAGALGGPSCLDLRSAVSFAGASIGVCLSCEQPAS